jgi:hypothetical protein
VDGSGAGVDLICEDPTACTETSEDVRNLGCAVGDFYDAMGTQVFDLPLTTSVTLGRMEVATSWRGSWDAQELVLTPIRADSPAVASSGSLPTQVPAGAPAFSFTDDPLLCRVATALAGRVWDGPLPDLSKQQWIQVVDLVADCVRSHDSDKRWLDADTRAERMADAANRGE